MKILIVNKFLFHNGGSETYVFELGKALQQRGHDVQYFGMEHTNRIVGNAVNIYTSNVDFHNISGIAKILAPFSIIYSVEARKKIRKVLDDFRPDVVHLNNINFQITPSIIYEIREWEKKNTSVKVVYTAHDYQWICPNHMLYIPQNKSVCELCVSGKYVECTRHNCIHGSKMRSILGSIEGYYYSWRGTYGLVDSIICPSKFLFDMFNRNKILRGKLVMLHNFIASTDRFFSEATERNSPYVLYFGRYDEQKGIKTLISVCKRNPDIKFVFAGKGPLENEVISTNNIKNVGFKVGEELAQIISGALFSVYPSEWYENCPFSVMESIYYGTPVIGSNIGGVPELINTDEYDATGILFEAGNVDSLENAIRTLWDDRIRLDTYTKNCVKYSYDDVEEYINKLLIVYNS